MVDARRVLLLQRLELIPNGNVRHLTVLHEFTRVRELLDLIDESGGRTEELNKGFAERTRSTTERPKSWRRQRDGGTRGPR
jgi:hypothetical protein